jgi:hypothetical protein
VDTRAVRRFYAIRSSRYRYPETRNLGRAAGADRAHMSIAPAAQPGLPPMGTTGAWQVILTLPSRVTQA